MTIIRKDFTLLPAAPGTCPECAVQHEPDQPHNQQSLFYRMKFYQVTGRLPTWADALAHCTPEVRERWENELRSNGVVI